MKQLSCKEMGGPCGAMIKGNSMKEIADNGMKHVQKAHLEMADKMKKMSKAEGEKWMKDMQSKFNAAPAM